MVLITIIPTDNTATDRYMEEALALFRNLPAEDAGAQASAPSAKGLG